MTVEMIFEKFVRARVESFLIGSLQSLSSFVHKFPSINTEIKMQVDLNVLDKKPSKSALSSFIHIFSIIHEFCIKNKNRTEPRKSALSSFIRKKISQVILYSENQLCSYVCTVDYFVSELTVGRIFTLSNLCQSKILPGNGLMRRTFRCAHALAYVAGCCSML